MRKRKEGRLEKRKAGQGTIGNGRNGGHMRGARGRRQRRSGEGHEEGGEEGRNERCNKRNGLIAQRRLIWKLREGWEDSQFSKWFTQKFS
jgi:hypothetical protein